MERYLRVNLLGPGPRLMKEKNLPGHGLTKFKKDCSRSQVLQFYEVEEKRRPIEFAYYLQKIKSNCPIFEGCCLPEHNVLQSRVHVQPFQSQPVPYE